MPKDAEGQTTLLEKQLQACVKRNQDNSMTLENRNKLQVSCSVHRESGQWGGLIRGRTGKNLYQHPVAAMTNYHQVTGLYYDIIYNIHACNICTLYYKLTILVLEVRSPKVQAGLFILEGLEENPFPCRFQSPDFTGSWSPLSQSQQHSISSLL